MDDTSNTMDPAVTGEGQEADVVIDEAGGVAQAVQGADMAGGEDQTVVATVTADEDGSVEVASDGDVIPASISGLVGSSSAATSESPPADPEGEENDIDLLQDMDGFAGMVNPLLTFFEALDVMKQGAVVTRVEWARNTPENQVPRVLAFTPGACQLDIRPPGATHWRGVPLTLFHAVEGGAVTAPGFISNGHDSDRGLNTVDLLAEDWVIADGVENPVLPLPAAA